MTLQVLEKGPTRSELSFRNSSEVEIGIFWLLACPFSFAALGFWVFGGRPVEIALLACAGAACVVVALFFTFGKTRIVVEGAALEVHRRYLPFLWRIVGKADRLEGLVLIKDCIHIGLARAARSRIFEIKGVRDGRVSESVLVNLYREELAGPLLRELGDRLRVPVRELSPEAVAGQTIPGAVDPRSIPEALWPLGEIRTSDIVWGGLAVLLMASPAFLFFWLLYDDIVRLKHGLWALNPTGLAVCALFPFWVYYLLVDNFNRPRITLTDARASVAVYPFPLPRWLYRPSSVERSVVDHFFCAERPRARGPSWYPRLAWGHAVVAQLRDGGEAFLTDARTRQSAGDIAYKLNLYWGLKGRGPSNGA